MKTFRTANKTILYEDYGQNIFCRVTGKENHDVTIIKLIFTFPTPTQPEKVSFTYSKPAIGADGVWTPCGGMNRYLTPDWGPFTVHSRSVSGYPILSVVSLDDTNVLTVGIGDAQKPCALKAGYREEGSVLVFTLDLFTDITEPICRYETEVIIDERRMHFAKTVADIAAMHSAKYHLQPAPPSAFKPMFSTWYCMHQELYRDRVIKECLEAKKMGFEYVIVDDGWQTDDNGRGYAFAGEYRPAENKLGDIRSFTDTLHQMDMKCLLWFSLAFSGDNVACTQTFKDMALYHSDEQKAYVVDPRFHRVREHIVSYCVEAVSAWGFDGLKLDFIDWFYLTDETAVRDGVDCASLEEGIALLIDELNIALKRVDPEVLIEFRQKYIGPEMQRLGNMLRVGDCPGSFLQNRISIIDLRLIAGERAVHADPVEWNIDERPEIVAKYLINCIFGVLQYSVLPSGLSREQRAVSERFLSFMKEYEQVLLHGQIIPSGMLCNYTSCKALKGDIAVVAMYANTVCDLTQREVVLLNGTGCEMLTVYAGKARYSYRVEDCLGTVIERGGEASGHAAIRVPTGGFVFMQLIS